MTGLKFDPQNPLGNPSNTGTSVPTVVDDYLSPEYSKSYLNSKTAQLVLNPNPLPELSPTAKRVNSEILSATLNLTPEEREQVLNPTWELNKWRNGLSGLSEEERAQWEEENAAKLEGKDEDWADRLWKNQQFLKKFGQDKYNAMAGRAKDRDEYLTDQLAYEAIARKYGTNDNVKELLGLSTQGKLDLLDSGYKNNNSIAEEKEAIDKMEDVNILAGALRTNGYNASKASKDWESLSFSDRMRGLGNQISESTKSWSGTGSQVGVLGGFGGMIAGTALGAIGGAVYGTLEGLENPKAGLQASFNKRVKDNEAIFSKILAADNNRIKEEHISDINALKGQYVEDCATGKISEKQIDDEFNEIALNHTKTVTDELGNTREQDYVGSTYYTAFKDSNEFEHFDVYDKMKYIAQTKVLQSYLGTQKALQILDQDMQQYVSDNQSGWTWAANTGKAVIVGGIANLGMNLTGLGALNAKIFYGQDGLNNYLQGKDAKDGSDNWGINNPQYWNKVDEYNDLGIDLSRLNSNWGNHLLEAEKYGISTANNVYAPGSENDFWSWSTFNEAIKMNKFFWSDAVKNITLAKMLGGATKLLGGKELEAGILATESSTASKVINKLGHAGIMANSSVGIDAAYGMQTYNDVLQQNQDKLDQIIQQDAWTDAEAYLQTPEAMREFERMVEEENQRRKIRAGERNPYISVDREKAWEAYVQLVADRAAQNQGKQHQEDRARGEQDAALAYMIDATIEAARMATTNGMFKSYMFDKGTLNALKLNSPYVATTTKEGAYALAKNATAKKALGIIGNNVWGGFHSNYFDDVTVGFAEAIGLQDYNNYLLTKYSPGAYGSVLDDYVTLFAAGVGGANDAMTEKRSVLDGAVGAIGTVFTFAPNISGMRNHKDRMKQIAKSIEKAEGSNVKISDLSAVEQFNDFFSNPILQAISDAKGATRMTEAEIGRINNILKENKYSLDNMVEAATALNQKAIARQGNSVIQAEDAKDREAITLATTLLDLKNSSIVSDAQVEPDRTTWSRKKKAADAIGNTFNLILGVNYFQSAESPYTRAMQALEDASSIEEMSQYYANANEVSEEEIDNDPEAARDWRQSTLINTFLGLDENKGATSGMSQEQKIQFAKERLKKNADNLLGVMNRVQTLQEKFDKSADQRLTPAIRRQLMFQYVLDDRFKSRLLDLESTITGEDRMEDFEAWRSKQAASQVLEKDLVARYGSENGAAKAIKEQERVVERAQKAYDKAALESQKRSDPKLTIRENSLVKYQRYQTEKQAKKELKKQQKRLQKMNKELSDLKALVNPSVLTAEEILRLNPDDRLRMLDDFYREDYSDEQQTEIDRAKNILIKDGTTIDEAMQNLVDASILNQRIQDNMETAKEIMHRPMVANLMLEAADMNRRRAIVDYFNDKVVAEAFNEFMNDDLATTSTEKAAEKAKKYSTAVLNGIYQEGNKMLKAVRSSEDASDVLLTNLVDGVDEELSNRLNRQGEVIAFDSFIKKTDKLTHPEVSAVAMEGSTAHMVTPTQRELSKNDRDLINTAIDYAVDHDIPIEGMPERIAGSENLYDQFLKYQEEANHVKRFPTGINTKGVTAEERAAVVPMDYMYSLLSDALSTFDNNKKGIKDAATPKPTSAPESIVIGPKDSVAPEEDTSDKRPDDSYNPDPFGALAQAKAEEEGTPDRNSQIISVASVINERLIGDLTKLLEDVDKLETSDEVKGNIKDMLESLLSTRPFDNIKALQNYLLGEALRMDRETSNAATVLAGKTFTSKPTSAPAEKEANVFQPNQTTPFLGLETIDLDAVIDNPKRPTLSQYAKDHGIVAFLQKLYNVWADDIKNKGKRHQAQVYFIYDPDLASHVEQEIAATGGTYVADQAAPVVMALEITDVNKDLLEKDDSGNYKTVVTIKDRATGTERMFQPLGFMPASLNSVESLQTTVQKMPAIRKQIRYSETVGGKEVPLTETRLIRYSPNKDTGKDNGTPIHTNIAALSTYTEEGARPEGTRETPWKSSILLMEENVNAPLETFITSTPEERQAYEADKKKGIAVLRNNGLYQRMRETFIHRLTKGERKAKDLETGKDTKELRFTIRKGNADAYPAIVFTQPISATADKNNPARLIVDLLKDIDAEGDSWEEATAKAKELIASNSRFKKLFSKLNNIKMKVGLFNSSGQRAVSENAYNDALSDYSKSVAKALEDTLTIYNPDVKTTIEDAGGSKRVNVEVYSDNKLLSSFFFPYGDNLSEVQMASFIKNLILDENGEVRMNPKKPGFELVKWQVIYENATTANDKSATPKQRDDAFTDLADLYDDGVLMMQKNKLSYPSRSVTAAINGFQRNKLWPAAEPKATVAPSEVTETKASFEVETVAGKVDGDTGMRTDRTPQTPLSNGAVERIKEIVVDMIEKSKTRNESEDNPSHYIIDGQIYSRVTSVKYDTDGMGKRFDPQSGWALPSSKIGNSLDAFGRDVFNGVFNKMTDAERDEAFGNYDNSTKENYAEVYKSLKAFQGRLAAKGQAIIATGTLEDPGKITAKGLMNVTVADGQNRQIRVAGTLDVLAIDNYGNLHIYDFKTHHGEEMNKTIASDNNHGYDRQLSMYAQFLEEEYGLPVKSINIIPIYSPYPTPSGTSNGEAIKGAQKTYRETRPGSNQLEVKNIGEDDSKYVPFTGAAFKVGTEFALDRLSGSSLVLAYDKMTEAEKEAIVEAVQDQSSNPSDVQLSEGEVKKATPEVSFEEEDEEEGEGFNFAKIAKEKRIATDSAENPVSQDEVLHTLNPDNSVQKDIEDQKKNCGGPLK